MAPGGVGLKSSNVLKKGKNQHTGDQVEDGTLNAESTMCAARNKLVPVITIGLHQSRPKLQIRANDSIMALAVERLLQNYRKALRPNYDKGKQKGRQADRIFMAEWISSL